MPFENTRHEPRLHWLSEGAAVLLADELKARGVSAIARDERVRAFEELHLPLSASLSRATVIKVGQIVGATEVVVGEFALDGGTLAITARSIRVDVGRLAPDVTEQSPVTALFALFDRLAGRLVPDAKPASAARGTRPPPDAFEYYVKGLIAESPAAKATFLENAIVKSPGYDRAQIALWAVRTDQGDDAAALAVARAVAADSPLAPTARFLAGVSLLDLKRHDEAFEAFKSLTLIVTTRSLLAAAYNNLGVVQIRRGGTPQTGSAVFYLTKAADTDPGDADIQFNLGYAYVLERNTQGAVYWLREALRRDPADADAHYVLGAALQASGSSVEAGREKELATRLSSRYEEIERRATPDAPVLKDLERVSVEPEPANTLRPEQAIVNSAQREQRELATFHLDRGRRLFERVEDREALAELRRAVYLSPYEAQAHLLIGRIHLRAGQPQEAIDALKISIWSEDSAPARVALAEAYLKVQNTAAARTELERALVLDPGSADAKRILAGIK